jgi:hypothetical protein
MRLRLIGDASAMVRNLSVRPAIWPARRTLRRDRMVGAVRASAVFDSEADDAGGIPTDVSLESVVRSFLQPEHQILGLHPVEADAVGEE